MEIFQKKSKRRPRTVTSRPVASRQTNYSESARGAVVLMNEKEWQQDKNPAASGRQTGAGFCRSDALQFCGPTTRTRKKKNETDDDEPRGGRERAAK